jgi:hypothetical protein
MDKSSQLINKITEINKLLDNTNLDDIDTINGLNKHNQEIKQNYQISLIESRDNGFKSCFMKLYIMEDDQWNFHVYGWLHPDKFIADKTMITMFNIFDPRTQIQKHPHSKKHILIIGEHGDKFLLYNHYPETIQIISNYFNNFKYFLE